ncbi:MAG: hypothetical protein R6V40_01440 [Candidatus Moraniibacteriota bacterium]
MNDLEKVYFTHGRIAAMKYLIRSGYRGFEAKKQIKKLDKKKKKIQEQNRALNKWAIEKIFNNKEGL